MASLDLRRLVGRSRRRSLFRLISVSPPTDQLPLLHPSLGKNRVAFPLEINRLHHSSSLRARAEAVNAAIIFGRLTRALGVCVLLFVVVAFVSKVGGEVLMALSWGWEGNKGW